MPDMGAFCEEILYYYCIFCFITKFCCESKFTAESNPSVFMKTSRTTYFGDVKATSNSKPCRQFSLASGITYPLATSSGTICCRTSDNQSVIHAI